MNLRRLTAEGTPTPIFCLGKWCAGLPARTPDPLPVAMGGPQRKKTPRVGAASGRYQRMSLSRDGKQLLVVRLEAGSHRGDYWVWDMERKIWTRMTSHSSPGGGIAIWSPDKRRIAFAFISRGPNTST